jgi:hypothetical protein
MGHECIATCEKIMIVYLENGRRSKKETPNAVDKATLGSEPREERHQVFPSPGMAPECNTTN